MAVEGVFDSFEVDAEVVYAEPVEEFAFSVKATDLAVFALKDVVRKGTELFHQFELCGVVECVDFGHALFAEGELKHELRLGCILQSGEREAKKIRDSWRVSERLVAMRVGKGMDEREGSSKMEKAEIIEALNEIGVLLELKGENPFKIRAYQAGARTLESLEKFEERLEEGTLDEVQGIGAALTEKVTALWREGRLEYLEKLRRSVPAGLLEMLEVPGLGGKKIKALRDALGVESIGELKAACEAGKVAELKGFGAKSQEKILSGIVNREAYNARHLWWAAKVEVEPILSGLRALPEVECAEAAGSFRRRMETVGDLDFIVASAEPGPVMDWFVSREKVVETTARGETKASVRLAGGMQADLRVVPAEQFFFALHHFTGSKDHNVLMRRRALGMGLSLSEWGLKAAEEGSGGSGSVVLGSEEELFAALGLSYVPPELREGREEIGLSESGSIPPLLETEDLRGVFHNHTTRSDGRDTLRDMAEAAAAKGWEYLGLADHSKASVQANGLDEERVLAQVEEVAAFNASGEAPLHVFSGIEVDVLGDGVLDLPDEVLRQLDYVVASVHSRFSQTEEEMTARLVRAIEHPCVTMLGHLTGRLLLKREPYGVKVDKVVDAAAAHGKIIEINANPRRLDMDWRHWRKAADKGVLACINPDAHATDHYEFVEAGVHVARKGMLAREEIFNTLPLDDVRERLVSMRG